MYGGAAIARLGGRRARVTVPAGTAATIYLFNIRRWLADRVDHASRQRLLELRRGLEVLAREDDGETVTWIVRQIALPAPGVRPAGM